MPESFFRENGKEVFGRLVCERVAEKRVGRGSAYRPDDALCGTKRFQREARDYQWTSRARGFEESRSEGEVHIARMMRYEEQSVFLEGEQQGSI